MPNISIRNLNKAVYDQLCIQAASHGVSMEEEVCQIISLAVSAPQSISMIFKKHFGIKNGINLDRLSNDDRKQHEPMD